MTYGKGLAVPMPMQWLLVVAGTSEGGPGRQVL